MPLLQELETSLPFGRATTKAAMMATKKRASLENMVKMKVGGGLGFASD